MTSCSAGEAAKPVKREYDLVIPATHDGPLCEEPLSPSVFQIKGCPSCSRGTGRIRSIALETVSESLEVSCRHAPKRYKEKLKQVEIDTHKMAPQCKFSGTYICPVSDCGHEMPMVKMLDHITDVHGEWNFVALNSLTPVVKFSTSMDKRWKKFMIITGTSMKEGSSLFLHFEEKGSLGVLFFCTSVGISKVFYNLKVKPRDGSASYVLETTAPFLRKKGEFSACRRHWSLLIPTDIDCDDACCKFDVELSFPEAS
ncbi:hypothetical protein M758_11G140000 [Ceratodon purpureus]|nr:hypothetical protein M758_11G140000 [Ceratodon purpureus]